MKTTRLTSFFVGMMLASSAIFSLFSIRAQSQRQNEIDSILNETAMYDPLSCSQASPAQLPSTVNLDPASREKIQGLLPVYQKHADRLGFPWQILAAKHYRETGLSLRNPSNNQGIWQLYTLVETQKLYSFPENPNVSIEEFDRQTGIMVDWYFTGEKLEWARRHSLLDLQKLFTYYNGWGEIAKTLAYYNALRVGVQVDRNNGDALLNWNAYGMNQYSDQHKDMIAKISDTGISVAAAASAAQSIIDTGQSNSSLIGINRATGAVPIYAQLGGPINGITTASTNSSATNTSNSKIYVIGDSLTVGMTTFLNASLGASLVGPIEATTGISIQNSIEKVVFPADTNTVLIGLGTNNFADSPDTFKGHVLSLVEKVRSINPNAQIFWTNIYAPRTDIASASDGLNAKLSEVSTEQQAAGKSFNVIDWKSEALANGYTFPDQLHPREYEKRAEFIVRTIGAVSGQSNNTANNGGACADSGSGRNGAVAGNVTQTALNFSWTESAKVAAIRAVKDSGPCSMLTNPGSCGQQSRDAGALIGEDDAKPEYVTAVKEFNRGNDSDGSSWAFSDCGVFVATVMRASGADPEYQARGTSLQQSYVENSSKYEVIPFTDTALLRPGDVLIKDGHTRIYVGQNSLSEFNVAEASWGNHVPTTLYNATVSFSNANDRSEAAYIIARLK